MRIIMSGAIFLGLTACDVPNLGQSPGREGFLSELPEGVIANADPSQDLSAVRINVIDGCYEYRHIGPVETTFLPLRTSAGNPICSKPAEAA
ncbi:MAG: hypothetical protein AB8B71_03265 [Paracoccaceae bacterium]